ncbi:MAG: Allantoinase [Bacteroidetes bacterium ADurb.Bin408]|nr:MAG: Allantoinase [Bacteroidetes bacterium ADurb.Bin408]
MSSQIYITNAFVVNEGQIFKADVTVKDGLINEILPHTPGSDNTKKNFFITFSQVINAEGLYLLPGVIDCHVHFREPGLTHKADIFSESKAAVAGGVTSYMDMPNTFPQATTLEILENKFHIASQKSLANYSFFLGATNDNIDAIARTDPHLVCGVKVFMGSSTGHMLVDNTHTLNKIFELNHILVAAHCEDEGIIRSNIEKYKRTVGEDLPVEYHPLIRNKEACYASSKLAVALAKKYNTRLHILHVSTRDELRLFQNDIPLIQKRITSEACVHHLIFNKSDYKRSGRLIKVNPAIKNKTDQNALIRALKTGLIDIVSTDHAPHTYEEKQQPYFKSASGAPMIQHSLQAMIGLYHRRLISLPDIVNKMCHAPADCFRIEKRGYIRKGYHADLVLVDINAPVKVNYDNILYKCGWSPLVGEVLPAKITHTFVNGHMVYENGVFYNTPKGQRLLFDK